MDEQDKIELGKLLKELAEGNPNVLSEIIRILERVLKTIANVYYRNREDVEDAVSDFCLKLYNNAKKFRHNKNAYAWTTKVFENDIKSDLRARQLEREYIEEMGAELCASASANALDEEYIENHLFLHDIFKNLTDEEKDLVIYYHWYKRPIREVAAILHQSKSTIGRKLKQLEEKVKNFEDFLK